MPGRKRKHESKEEKDVKEKKKIMQDLQRTWSKPNNLASKGSNNATGLAGLVRIFGQLPELSANMVFADFGSGCGFPCIYASLHYGCQSYGIELEESVVKIAREYAEKAGVGHLCHFEVMDLDKLNINWARDKGITHVYSFDRVISAPAFNMVVDAVRNCQSVVAVVSCFPDSYWNSSSTKERKMLSKHHLPAHSPFYVKSIWGAQLAMTGGSTCKFWVMTRSEPCNED